MPTKSRLCSLDTLEVPCSTLWRTPANVHVVSPADGPPISHQERSQYFSVKLVSFFLRQTALHIAAAYGFSEVVAGILRHGGASDVQDAAGLMRLIKLYRRPAVPSNFLVPASALKVASVYVTGHTPMDYARDRLVLWLLNRFHGRDGLLESCPETAVSVCPLNLTHIATRWQGRHCPPQRAQRAGGNHKQYRRNEGANLQEGSVQESLPA